ncbi:hypothetical protein [Sedimenticola hydrogenitrophicus]|uniref:hypothetical protein n=1 Tax=Sedimenticola hydrogenitrophicus TaxID=2967975 RepID=UPI0023AFAFF8|nr:hypothetical protein [Sedimenticola hydrogenitrophicus]
MSKSASSKKKIEEYFSLINNVVDGFREVSSKRYIGTLIISDSVILSVRKTDDRKSNIEMLRQLCMAIRTIQYRLALNNIWLRGGVSSGDAYFSASESQIVGPAYINAYNLEKRIAIYPRVIIDTNLINELKCESADSLIDEINTYNPEQSKYGAEGRDVLFQWNKSGHETVGMKKDVALFVDYLAPSFAERNKLKRVVNNVVKSMYQDNQVYSKYRWVVEYLMARCIPLNKYHGLHQSKEINVQFDRLRGL